MLGSLRDKWHFWDQPQGLKANLKQHPWFGKWKFLRKNGKKFIFIQIKDRYLSLLVSLSTCEGLQAVLWLLWGITSRITSYLFFKFFTNGNNNSFLKKIWNLHFVFTIMNNYIFRRPGQLIKFRVIMNQFLKQHPDSEGYIMVLFWLYRHLHFCTLIMKNLIVPLTCYKLQNFIYDFCL